MQEKDIDRVLDQMEARRFGIENRQYAINRRKLSTVAYVDDTKPVDNIYFTGDDFIIYAEEDPDI